MRLKTLSALILLGGFALAGCKKEEETESAKYVLGSLTFDMPEYAQYGEVLEMTPSGAYHPDCTKQKDGTYRDSLGYYFMTSYDDVKDTVKKFTDPVGAPKTFRLTVRDTKLGKVIVSAYAFAPDCYSASASKNLQVVNPGYGEGYSITGFEYSASDPTVAIGSRNYYTTMVNGRTWLRENVGLETMGVPRANVQVMYKIFGGFYNYSEALSVCPDGWELPSKAEYEALVGSVSNVGDLYGNIKFNDTKMWTYWRDVHITDATRMSIIPVGFAVKADDNVTFKDIYKRAVFWTKDSADENNAIACYFYESTNCLYSGAYNKNDFYASVRCIKKL